MIITCPPGLSVNKYELIKGVIMVKYEFGDYVSSLLIWPALFCAISTALLIGFFRYLHSTSKPVQKYLLLIIPIILIALNLYKIKFGFPLLFESSNDAQCVVGIVEETKELTLGPYYHVDSLNGRFSKIIIDGESYYIMTSDAVPIGKKVALTYLPQSRLVLTSDIVIE